MASGAVGAIQIKGEVLSLKRVGSYYQMAFTAPGIAERAKPGNFVAIAVGGADSSMLLRRSFSILSASPRGLYGGTIEIVFSVAGRGTAWMSRLAARDVIDVVGPLGKPFALPKEPINALLVGGGYGSAPLFSLAEALRGRGCRVDTVIGASTADRLFGQIEGRRHSNTLTITTDDGSFGTAGRVTDVLDQLITDHRVDVIYACGPMPMLQSIAAMGAARSIVTQCAVEEAMACGVGVCMTCVLPVRGRDGIVRMTRSCVDGPVFDGASVLWDQVGSVPDETLGADAMVGH